MAQAYKLKTGRRFVYTALMLCLFCVYTLQRHRENVGLKGQSESLNDQVFKKRHVLENDEESMPEIGEDEFHVHSEDEEKSHKQMPGREKTEIEEEKLRENNEKIEDERVKRKNNEKIEDGRVKRKNEEEMAKQEKPDYKSANEKVKFEAAFQMLQFFINLFAKEKEKEKAEETETSEEKNKHTDDSQNLQPKPEISEEEKNNERTITSNPKIIPEIKPTTISEKSNEDQTEIKEINISTTIHPITESGEDEAESPETQGVQSHKRILHKPIPRQGDTCLIPAYHEFPDDLFTNSQRAKGAVIIHLLVGVYMFYALAVVCDGYFVTSLEKISEKIGLSEDVAGATFMAAGSSAPELFASLLGVFVAKSDVGTGTIVGSAIFNVLFVIGICAFFTEKPLSLDWWPLMRDSTFYALTVLVLMGVIADGAVQWWETVIMLVLYVLYIVLMKYNLNVRLMLTENTGLQGMDSYVQTCKSILEERTTYAQFDNKANQEYVHSHTIPPDEYIRDYPRRMSLYEATYRMMMTRHFRPKTRFWSAAKRIILEIRRIKREGIILQPCIDDEATLKKRELELKESVTTSDDWKRIPSLSEGVSEVVKWILTVPVQAVLYYTIPNCRKQRWEKWFVATFISSMLWIALFSYVLVWMVTLIGFTCGIPDTVMGMTFLAAGTSVPDAISSIIVARQGQADMAVSNSIGSNVFDILIGLALPWFLQTVIVMPGTTLYIYSQGMWHAVILLFIAIALTLTCVHQEKWHLTRKLGIMLLCTYCVILLMAVLTEYNILFGVINLPECTE